MKQLQVIFKEVDKQMLISITTWGDKPSESEEEFCEILRKMTRTTCKSILQEMSNGEA